ncbi:helix-turn-helix domain-containing protein [Actinoallomurus purpureus]|uniref:ArsR/SmtB family transcription factor n=1 Tax=Actinoallomurus purpureus TaxID=478114 RepID=UPI002093C306|nr:helix-turn-helix domain-containing protein [Actinoallomurus purpureus]MCO6011227.1 helix-turn-helix domain-containing protein [Actinoallomurus purpureus]
MARSQRRVLTHPEVGEVDLLDVLHALADPTRMTVVRTLRAEPERACGTFPVDVAPSTLTHHFRVLREAGVIRQREDGNLRWNTLRLDDLDARFPGLLDAIVTAYERQESAPGRSVEAAAQPH